MTDILVDGASVTLPDEGQETVADVVGLVSSKLDAKKRIIRVFVDDDEVTGNREQHLRTLASLNKISLETGLASDLAQETLESIDEFQSALINELSRTAELFRIDTFEKSNEAFARCLDGLQILLNTTLSVAGLIQVGAPEVVAGEGTLEECTRKISRILDELIEAQTNRDGILVADLIEYELHPLLEDWPTVTESLRGLSVAL
jgi:hypothetical protein